MNLRGFCGAVCVATFLIAAPGSVPAAAWETSIYPEEQIFPSFLISTATAGLSGDEDDVWDCPQIGDVNSVIGALFHNVKKGDRVRVVVKDNALMAESSFDGVSPKTTKNLLVHPRIKYRYAALAKVRQHEPLDVSIEVWLNGQSLGEQTATADVHSINDCLFEVVDEHGDVEFDATSSFAAYVNEDHPMVDEILRDALDAGIVDAFDGYQADKSEQVLLQVYAVWHVLQNRGMRYSDIKANTDESDIVLSQYVRLLDETLRMKQANCVDGSVLLASVLRKLGLRTFLAIEPDHMFVAVDLKDDDDRSMIGIETTMMGDEDLKQFDALKKITAAQRGKLKKQASFKTFEAAVDEGTQEIERHEKAFRRNDGDYQLLDIAEARRDGIKPIGYSP